MVDKEHCSGFFHAVLVLKDPVQSDALSLHTVCPAPSEPSFYASFKVITYVFLFVLFFLALAVRCGPRVRSHEDQVCWSWHRVACFTTFVPPVVFWQQCEHVLFYCSCHDLGVKLSCFIHLSRFMK